MLISLIVCTLGERIFEFSRLIDSLKEQTFRDFELIVVTQINHTEVSGILGNSGLDYKHIRIERKGLSLSRNIAMEYVSGAFCTISDDDCWYPSDALEKISRYLNGDSNAVAFKIFDPLTNLPYKDNYPVNSGKMNWLTIGRVSSIELFFNSHLISKGIKFDENFGLGAQYPAGEENIFLSDILKKKCRVTYISEFVVYHLRPSKIKRDLPLVRMRTVFMTFLRMYGWVGIFLYYVFYLKHFCILLDKFESLFPFWFVNHK